MKNEFAVIVQFYTHNFDFFHGQFKALLGTESEQMKEDWNKVNKEANLSQIQKQTCQFTQLYT